MGRVHGGQRWESLPERHVGATDNGISVEATIFSRHGRIRTGKSTAGRRRPPRFASASTTSMPGRTTTCRARRSFPPPSPSSSGTIRWTLGARARVVLFFKQLWNGFTPSGIGLTYAWGNGLPVGSMYRLREEETVFVVAGPEEAGKTISSTRRLADDFKAAYGRPPKGPVTEVRVSARRPSREKGPVRASITVRFPAPPE